MTTLKYGEAALIGHALRKELVKRNMVGAQRLDPRAESWTDIVQWVLRNAREIEAERNRREVMGVGNES